MCENCGEVRTRGVEAEGGWREEKQCRQCHEREREEQEKEGGAKERAKARTAAKREAGAAEVIRTSGRGRGESGDEEEDEEGEGNEEEEVEQREGTQETSRDEMEEEIREEQEMEEEQREEAERMREEVEEAEASMEWEEGRPEGNPEENGGRQGGGGTRAVGGETGTLGEQAGGREARKRAMEELRGERWDEKKEKEKEKERRKYQGVEYWEKMGEHQRNKIAKGPGNRVCVRHERMESETPQVATEKGTPIGMERGEREKIGTKGTKWVALILEALCKRYGLGRVTAVDGSADEHGEKKAAWGAWDGREARGGTLPGGGGEPRGRTGGNRKDVGEDEGGGKGGNTVRLPVGNGDGEEGVDRRGIRDRHDNTQEEGRGNSGTHMQTHRKNHRRRKGHAKPIRRRRGRGHREDRVGGRERNGMHSVGEGTRRGSGTQRVRRRDRQISPSRGSRGRPAVEAAKGRRNDGER